MRTFIGGVGDANDIRTWSGIPYHLLQEGRRQGVIDEGLPLSAEGWRYQIPRYLWNLAALLQGDRPGGYQYSLRLLNSLWAPVHQRLRQGRVINFTQLYPPALVRDDTVQRWYFLDQTLLQLFDTYGIRAEIGRAIAADALTREREGYQAAAGIMVNSQWAANSVSVDYGIPADKIHVVVPGANVDSAAYDAWAQGYQPPCRADEEPLRLVFVGKHPYRKGLDRLLRALRRAAADGVRCTLRIIGCQPTDLEAGLRDLPGVEWYGFVDKRRDGVRYLNAVAECDVGCLLSRAEAGGIGLREYHALGLAAIGPNVGGSPDHVIPEAAVLVAPEADDEAIAALLVDLDRDRERVARMRAISWERRKECLWSTAVRTMGNILDGPLNMTECPHS